MSRDDGKKEVHEGSRGRKSMTSRKLVKERSQTRNSRASRKEVMEVKVGRK
jgi:hypothetical protein